MARVRIFKAFRAASVVALLGVLALGTGLAKDPLPEGGAAKQMEADLAFLKEGLGKKAKNSVGPLKSTAMLVALSAQNQADGAEGEKMAGVRDTALKIAEALSKKEVDWAGAAKAAEGFATAKGDPKKVVKLEEQHEFDLSELMSAFKPKNRGGRGWENDAVAQGKKATDTKAILELALGVQQIGAYSELFNGEDSAAKKKKWEGYAKDMQKLGKEAATEALKGDKADLEALTKKVEAINANCAACHSAFKNK